MFEKLIEEIKQEAAKEASNAVPNVEIDLSNYIDDPNALEKNLLEIDKLDAKSGYEFIKKNYKFMLTNERFQFAFKNPNILNYLTQICYETEFTYQETIYCNSVVYRFLTSVEEVDPYIIKNLLILANKLNLKTVNCLLGCDLDLNTAIQLAVASKSSVNPNVCVARFNFILVCLPNKVLGIQKVIDIYTAVYLHRFSELLIGTFFDVNVKQSEEREEYWITDEIKENDNAVTWAILFILESLPPHMITKYIYMIVESFVVSYGSDMNHVRASLHNLPRSFIKVPVIVQQLEGMEDGNIDIP